MVQTLFVLFQLMYLGFYIGALANLAEISDLLSPLPSSNAVFYVLFVTAAILIPARAFVLCAVLFRAPGFRGKFLLMLWPFLLVFDVLWSLSPFLLLHHINFGLALACTTLLVYSPFAQRSLVLMGAGSAPSATPPRSRSLDLSPLTSRPARSLCMPSSLVPCLYSKVRVEPECGNCHGSARLVVSGIVHVLKIVGNEETAPKVSGVEGLDDLLAAVSQPPSPRMKAQPAQRKILLMRRHDPVRYKRHTGAIVVAPP